jgi:hypothetical protein
VAGPRGGRAAADPAVHLLEPARQRGQYVRRIDQRRPQLLARDSHRGHSARAQPAGRQQQRDVAAHRERSRNSSCRPARWAPSTAAGRRPSQTSSSRSGTNEFHGVRGDTTCRIRRLDATAVRQRRRSGRTRPSRRTLQNWAHRSRRAGHDSETVQRQEPQLLLRDVRKDARRGTDVDHLPHAADAGVPERRLLTPVRSRLHGGRAIRHGGGRRRARASRPLRADLRSTHDAGRRRTRGARSVPEQPDPACAVGPGRAQHHRDGALG